MSQDYNHSKDNEKRNEENYNDLRNPKSLLDKINKRQVLSDNFMPYPIHEIYDTLECSCYSNVKNQENSLLECLSIIGAGASVLATGAYGIYEGIKYFLN
jgi:hypothetical protein